MAFRVRRAAASRWTLPALILVGVILRIGYIATKGLHLYEFEAGNVAIAFAQGKGLADAYFAGSGPTAHLLPTTPVIAGTIYILFGLHSTVAELLLFLFSLGQLVVSTLLIARLFALLGATRSAVLGAVACAMILPVTFQVDTMAFRVWDNGLAFIAVLVCLIDQVRVTRIPAAGVTYETVRSALVLALAAFVNPAMGPALAVGVFVVYFRERSFARAIAVGCATILVFAAISAPWMVRNERLFGEPIISRSNAGLELAMANHDAALSAAPAVEVFVARLVAIHPFNGGPGAAAFRRVGEPAYQNALGRETARWIAARPGGFATLALRHMFRMVTPQAWQMGKTMATARAVATAIACWSGIAALALLVWRDRSSPWWIVALFIGAALLAYAPFQPSDRYIYPFYQLLLFCAAAGIGHMLTRRLPAIDARMAYVADRLRRAVYVLFRHCRPSEAICPAAAKANSG